MREGEEREGRKRRKKEKEGSKTDNPFVWLINQGNSEATSHQAGLGTFQQMVAREASPPRDTEFPGAKLTSEFLQGRLSTLGVVARLHGHTP